MIKIDRQQYYERCRLRWSREALADALSNWGHWQDHNEQLSTALYRFKDFSGSLSDFLWKLQEEWQPDKGRLDPLIDFCDHYQRVHLRRGLLIYCEMLLAQIRPSPPSTSPSINELKIMEGL